MKDHPWDENNLQEVIRYELYLYITSILHMK